jgi:hypothetical protein
MKLVRSSILLLFLSGWIQACAPALHLDREYTLAYGEVMKYRTQGFRKEILQFQWVVEDSRCPTGVNCIQAGRALVQLSMGDSSFVLQEGQSRVYGKRSLLLQSLKPYPNAADTQPLGPERYRISFMLGKAESSAQ